jgi:hypothetical protein
MPPIQLQLSSEAEMQAWYACGEPEEHGEPDGPDEAIQPAQAPPVEPADEQALIRSMDDITAGRTIPLSSYLDYQKQLSDFHQRLTDAKDELAEASIAFAEIERLHKAAKKRCKAAVEQIEEISSSAPTHSGLSFQFADQPEWRNNPQSNTEAPAAVQQAPGPAGEASDAWKSVPVASLQLSSIKGLGVKILAAIAERCPTIGDLESLRAEGTGKGRGLRSIDRLGEEKAQVIEDRLIEWLTKNRDSHLFAAQAARPAEDVAEARAAQQVERARNIAEIQDVMDEQERLQRSIETYSTDYPVDGIPVDGAGSAAAYKTDLSDVDPATLADSKGRAVAVAQRVIQLNTGEPDCLACHRSTSAFTEGGNAFWDGEPIVNIPYVIGNETQGDDWLRGWLAAELEKIESEQPAEDESESEESEATETADA